MRIVMPAVSLAVFLAGCATPAEQAAQMEREMDRMVQIYGPACTRLGFNANTDPWRTCIIELGQKDAIRYGTSTYYGPGRWRHPYYYW